MIRTLSLVALAALSLPVRSQVVLQVVADRLQRQGEDTGAYLDASREALNLVHSEFRRAEAELPLSVSASSAARRFALHVFADDSMFVYAEMREETPVSARPALSQMGYLTWSRSGDPDPLSGRDFEDIVREAARELVLQTTGTFLLPLRLPVVYAPGGAVSLTGALRLVAPADYAVEWFDVYGRPVSEKRTATDLPSGVYFGVATDPETRVRSVVRTAVVR